MGRSRNRWSFATAKCKKTRMDTKTFHTSSAQCHFLMKAVSFSIKLSALTDIFCLHLFICKLYFPRNAISPAVSGFVSDRGGVYASNTPLETLQIKNGAMTNALRAANLLQKANLEPVWIRRGWHLQIWFSLYLIIQQTRACTRVAVVSAMTFWSHFGECGLWRKCIKLSWYKYRFKKKNVCSNGGQVNLEPFLYNR